VSHQPERLERNCLNCGTTVAGRYCQHCGQENIVTKESFWSLCKHFVYDIFHFDGKFYHTIKYIFTRPGFVAREYVEGKRASYLNPIRMYLFTSAVFFLVFFTMGETDTSAFLRPLTSEERKEFLADFEKKLERSPGDTSLLRQMALLKEESRRLYFSDLDSVESQVLIANSIGYHSIAEYDSAQNARPKSQRDNWLMKKLTRKSLELNSRMGDRPNQGISMIANAFMHRLPYLLFVSLPFFALILKLLYARRKNFFYSDHAIFTLFHYILSFILLLLIFAFDALKDVYELKIFTWIILMLFLGWQVYLYLEMKNFYRQGGLKTLIKWIGLNLLGMLLLLVLFGIFFIISILQM
jgi:hypothetical protein